MKATNKIRKVFITGGLGFIGSNLVASLLQNDYVIKIYDNYSSGSLENLKRLSIDVKKRSLSIVKGDILDKKKISKEMRGCDIVMHKAAQLEITKAVSDPYFDLQTNTVGTLHVLDAMRENKIVHLINASSACIYGQKSGKDIPTKEDSSTNPNWAYGASKLVAEKYCTIYSQLYGFKIVSTRYGIVYGQNEWYGRVMPIFIKRAIQGKKLFLFDDGSQSRDLIHVDDVVAFNLKAIRYLEKQKSSFHTPYNVSTGTGTTIKQLASLVQKNAKKLYNQNIVIGYDSVAEGQKSKQMDRIRLPSELKHMVLDNSRAQALLHWVPKIMPQEGVYRQMEWAKVNSGMWKKLSY